MGRASLRLRSRAFRLRCSGHVPCAAEDHLSIPGQLGEGAWYHWNTARWLTPWVPSRRWRSALASVEAAAVAGIVCALGWSIGRRGLLSAPAVDATDAQITRYYAAPDAGFTALLLLQVIVVATIAFCGSSAWFTPGSEMSNPNCSAPSSSVVAS